VEGCGKSFSLDFNLRSHLRAIHGHSYASAWQTCKAAPGDEGGEGEEGGGGAADTQQASQPSKEPGRPSKMVHLRTGDLCRVLGLVSATASAPSPPSLTRIMGKGSWTITVTPSGGVGRVVHRETGPDRRVILQNVDKEGTGNVMVGTLPPKT
jgi:hypothetical protein